MATQIILDFPECPGPSCHSGDFLDFDHFVDVNNIPSELVGEAFGFGFWLAGEANWNGTWSQMFPGREA